MQKLLAHAYEQVPYYRKLFDCNGLAPQDIKTPEDFRKIPLLSKGIVQEHREHLIARDHRGIQLTPVASGGSTGQPTRLYKHPAKRAIEVADTWGYHQWMGWQVGDRSMRLWGSLDPENFKRKTYRRLAQFCTQEICSNVHQIDEAAMKKIADRMQRFKPKILIGYTNALFTLATHLLEQRRSITGLLGVVTTAETLFPYQRELIEKAFGCRVFNRYASQEIGQLAGECSEGNLHLNIQNVYFEFWGEADPVSAGMLGSVVVTDLNNYAMPFIRYQLGDIGVAAAHSCSCGRGLPVIGELKGRLSDVIVTPDKRYIFADDIAEIFYPLNGIKQFQVIQENRENVTVKIVKNGEADSHEVVKRLQGAVGAKMTVKLEVVHNLPVLPSGKHRICISRICQN
ncbi:MAG: phenylacetate--CoA ligase family protein [bacterium]